MKIEQVPFTVTDWAQLPAAEFPGATGTAFSRAFEAGNVRVRWVDYSPGYTADHWCARGHIILVLEGELVMELKDGQRFTLTAGMSCQLDDDETNPHRGSTVTGAKLFLVD